MAGGVSILVATAPPTTATTLLSSSNPSTYGHPVTLTATVAPSNAPGVVEFLDGTTLLEAKPLNLSGQVQITTSLLAAGANLLVAIYNGVPGSWQPSESNTVNQAVSPLAGSGFQAPVAYPMGGGEFFTMVVGDFNGDDKPDLAIASNPQDGGGISPGTVNVLLGNGDGTFSNQGASPRIRAALSRFNRACAASRLTLRRTRST
jgi:hypothetical protein